MRKKIIRIFCLLLFSVLWAAILLFPGQALSLSLEGLNLWFQKMIPALFPFMILSGLLIGLGLSDSFASLFSPVLRPLFCLSDSCLYCLVIGFLCGFPMGARVCAQSYEKGSLSRREATLMLAFCNNIGPIYFTGYVLRLFPVQNPAPALMGMYGIPFLYGLLLRYTLFSDIAFLPKGKVRPKEKPQLSLSCFFSELNRSILSAIHAITALGGYMIFCNLLNLVPGLLWKNFPLLLRLTGPLLEITSGLSRLLPRDRFWAFVLLVPGGLSCIAQTYSCLDSTDLSLKEYVFHKGIQTLLAAAFYGIWTAV